MGKNRIIVTVLVSISLASFSPSMQSQALSTAQEFVNLLAKTKEMYNKKEEKKPLSKSETLKKLVRSLENSSVQYDQGKVTIYPDTGILLPITGLILSAAAGYYFYTKDEWPVRIDKIGLSCLAGLFSLYHVIRCAVIGSKPFVTIEDFRITYQECGLFWDSAPQSTRWCYVDKIETRTKLFKDILLSALFDAVAGDPSLLFRLYSDVYVALRGRVYKDSILIPESKLPISFEEFYDLVSPHFWGAKETK